MYTRLWKMTGDSVNDKKLLAEAAKVLAEGGLVAFPTETVYGLGGSVFDERAAEKIYAAKGRPSDNPLIAHIAKLEDLQSLVCTGAISLIGEKLMETFWPGPLTLVYKKSDKVPYATTGGLDTVAVRMPSDPTARALIALAGVPIAAPSANTSGRPSPTTAEHVWEDMNGRIDMIIDGGAVGIGVESTIVDLSGDVPTVLRPGAVTMEMLEAVVGEVRIDPALSKPPSADVRPKAPGMKYRHYAPKASMVLVEGDFAHMVPAIRKLADEKLDAGYRVGILCTEETKDSYPCGEVISIGSRHREETIAHNLYGVLREFDELAVDYIYSEAFSKNSLGQAIMNRLVKAAGYHIIDADEDNAAAKKCE